MKNKKSLYLIILVLICLFMDSFIVDADKKGKTVDLIKELDNGLTLTYWYLPVKFLTERKMTTSIEHKKFYDYVAIVKTDTLSKHKSLLRQISKTQLIPLEQKRTLNVRLYCVFETKAGMLFTYSIGIPSNSVSGLSNYMEVNKNIVKIERSFCDFIIPFLPQSEIENFQDEVNQTSFK